MGELEVEFHSSLRSALDGGQWSASCCGYFSPGERAQSTPMDSVIMEVVSILEMCMEESWSF